MSDLCFVVPLDQIDRYLIQSPGPGSPGLFLRESNRAEERARTVHTYQNERIGETGRSQRPVRTYQNVRKPKRVGFTVPGTMSFQSCLHKFGALDQQVVL